MGPPRTYPMDPENRQRFRKWLGAEFSSLPPPTIADLIMICENRAWRDPQIICPAVFYTLDATDLDMVRRLTAARIARQPGGKWRDGGVVYDSDGTTFHATLLM